MPQDNILHYRILRPLGSGGMGEVFLAEDLILHRKVALKFLSQNAAADPELRERLGREARALATLSHPNIAAVHALETAGDRSFLVMEFVEGETLAERIARRPLPVHEVINSGIALAEGLTHAHSRGVVHRDVKPANVIVAPDGKLRLTDFGIATVVGAPTITGKGAITGTVDYMSPEQARGERGESRSDLFSLGVVMYEALTGTKPFAGARPEAILFAIQFTEPEPPTALRSGIPLELERIVRKCLQKDPALRYQHGDDLVGDLRRLGLGAPVSPAVDAPPRRIKAAIAIVSIAVALSTALWALGPQLGLRPRATDASTVLVVPMEVRGQAEGGDDAGRAFAEAVAVNLAQANRISVLPVPQRQEVRTQSTMRLTQVAARLGAGRLVTGSITREQKRVHVRVTLIDVVRNRLLWGGEKDSEEGDLAMLASFLANDLTSHLGARGRPVHEYFRYVSGSPAMTDWPELATTIGVLRRHETKDGLRLTGRLVEAFPSDPAARVMRLVALVDSDNLGAAGSREGVLAGIAALERIDPDNPNVAIHRANYLPERQVRVGLNLLNSVLARDDLTPALRSHALRTRSRLLYQIDETAAIKDLKEAISLDPANPFNYAYLAEFYRHLSRFSEAVAALRQATALEPDNIGVLLNLAGDLNSAGRTTESLAILARVCEGSQWVQPCAAYAQGLLDAGQTEQALVAATKAEGLEGTWSGYYNLACFWAVVGERTKALQLLRRAIREGMNSESISDLTKDRALASLHDDPEFKAIMSELARSSPPITHEREPH